MVRSLIRSSLVAAFVLALSMPAHALPRTGEREGFTFSLSVLWERLVSPIVALWAGGGTCSPVGGATTQGGGFCDPNG